MNNQKIIRGVLLVAGTAIGAGMLALPLSTASLGFFKSSLLFLIAWFFVALSGLLFIEITLWFSKEKDLITMVDALLPPPSKIITWFLYLLLLYAVIAAYFQGSMAWFMQLLVEQNYVLSEILGILCLAGLFGFVISYGTGITEKINSILAFGLFISFALMIFLAVPKVDLQNIALSHQKSSPLLSLGMLSVLPLVVAALSYTAIIPSLAGYFKRDIKALKILVWVGGTLPLLVYLVWEWVSFGVISSEGAGSLQALSQELNNGTYVTLALEKALGNSGISRAGRFFAIFAIATSLLGASLALFHCLADALKMKPQGSRRFIILACTYLPPVLIALFYPSGFSKILSFAGLLVAFLFGIIPVLLVWSKRYAIKGEVNIGKRSLEKRGTESGDADTREYIVPGGKPLLVLIFSFFAIVVAAEIINCCM